MQKILLKVLSCVQFGGSFADTSFSRGFLPGYDTTLANKINKSTGTNKLL